MCIRDRYVDIIKQTTAKDKYDISTLSENEKKVYRKLNQTLKKFGEEIEHFRFNTAIASLMELINELKVLENCSKEIQGYILKRFASMLAPVAPHLGDCLLYTSPSPRDRTRYRMPSSA